ncbi:MAG: T3SS (YopN, CesT) and YbjN peptide-binding chaperone 1 [Thermoanaerobaculia bacterium]
MADENAHVESARRRVAEYLEELFDEPLRDPESDSFHVQYGSTVLEIGVEPYGPEEVIVAVVAYCVQGVESDEALMRSLLELNHELSVGAFSLVDQDVFFAHTLFGRNLDRKDLLGAIAAVATISDEYDERIVERFGGQTALDRIGK